MRASTALCMGLAGRRSGVRETGMSIRGKTAVVGYGETPFEKRNPGNRSNYTEYCRAAKLAIKQAIAAHIAATKAREAAGEDAMEEDGDEPVPELTRAHFEEAMQSARRSVTDVEIRRYEAFAQSMKNSGGSSCFRFPDADAAAANGGTNGQFGDAGGDDDLYN